MIKKFFAKNIKPSLLDQRALNEYEVTHKLAQESLLATRKEFERVVAILNEKKCTRLKDEDN